MTKLEALIELRDKVKAGDRSASLKNTPLSGYGHYYEGCLNGFLDAAKALHDAVLPGWGWELYDEGCARVWPRPLGDTAYTQASHATPARAWLLAILEALIAQEQAV